MGPLLIIAVIIITIMSFRYREDIHLDYLLLKDKFKSVKNKIRNLTKRTRN